MKCPIIEPADGIVNGTNRVFRSSRTYRPSSLRVFLNGILNRRELVDGWVELGSNKVRLNEAPKTGDIVQVYYIPM
jgi:hypothetical protein